MLSCFPFRAAPANAKAFCDLNFSVSQDRALLSFVDSPMSPLLLTGGKFSFLSEKVENCDHQMGGRVVALR